MTSSQLLINNNDVINCDSLLTMASSLNKEKKEKNRKKIEINMSESGLMIDTEDQADTATPPPTAAAATVTPVAGTRTGKTKKVETTNTITTNQPVETLGTGTKG